MEGDAGHMPKGEILSVMGLSVEFPGRNRPLKAVDDFSFAVGAGEVVAIVGESGSGKSVTALAIMRLVEHDRGCITAGRVLFRRRDGQVDDLTCLAEPRMRSIRGNEIAMIFQEPMTSLNPVFPVGKQLAEVLELHRKMPRREALRQAQELLCAVKIPEAERRLAQHPHELSGGMRQRVMIAMAMACRPSLLIADEPTTALDVTIQAQILELIQQLRAETGMAVLLITHDMGVVAETADRVVVLRAGCRMEEAPVRAFFAAPRHRYSRSLLAAVPKLGSAPPLPPPARDAAPVLEVKNLVVRFPIRKGFPRRTVANLHAVEDVSFSLRPGETLGLVGESGSGKTTTARAILRLIKATKGEIRVAGRAVNGLSSKALRPLRRDMQMVFQDPYASLNPSLPVVELITEPLAIHNGLGADERRAKAERLADMVGIPVGCLDRYPHQFSGGQRQRIGIARALSIGPKVLLADEPVSALDVSIQAQVIELMLRLQSELGLAYVFISHDIAVVEQVSHQVAVLYMGEIVEHGPTAAVLHDPRHPYTRRLLAAVPVPYPDRRKTRAPHEPFEVRSPVYPPGCQPAQHPLMEIAPLHFVRET
jgi:ABC-type glutathione transport system ATPase component